MNMRLIRHAFIPLLITSLFFCCKKAQPDISLVGQNTQKKDNLIINKLNLKKEDILSWDYNQAFNNLGDPITEDSFPMTEIPEFRIELLRFLLVDPNLKIKELTWSIDSTTNLTVWYTQEEKTWKPVHFMQWNKNVQF